MNENEREIAPAPDGDDRPRIGYEPEPDASANAVRPSFTDPTGTSTTGSGPTGDGETRTSPESLRPIFYDAEHRRLPWIQRIGITTFALLIAGLLVLLVSVVVLPLMPHNPLPRAARAPEYGNQEPLLSQYRRHLFGITNHDHPLTVKQRRQLGVKFASDKQRLSALNQREEEKLREFQRKAVGFLQNWHSNIIPDIHSPAGFPPFGAPIEGRSTPPRRSETIPVVAAFYVNWEETSWASAQHNMEHLTHFIPEWLHLKSQGTDADNPDPKILPFLDARTEQDRREVTPLAHRNGVPILALLNNFTRPKNAEEGAGNWDTDAVHAVVSDPGVRLNFAQKLRDWLIKNQIQGINVDFEEVAPEDRDNLTLFMRDLYVTLHPEGLLVTQDVQLESDGTDIPALAKWNDWIVPMFYDQHEASS